MIFGGIDPIMNGYFSFSGPKTSPEVEFAECEMKCGANGKLENEVLAGLNSVDQRADPSWKASITIVEMTII